MTDLCILSCSPFLMQQIFYWVNLYGVINWIMCYFMSVELSQNQKLDDQQELGHRIDSVYQKFQKAHENMSSFKQMLTKFSTHRKPPTPNPNIEAFTIADPLPVRNKKTINLVLSQGWEYGGQTFEEKFHGYGILMQKGKSVYSGEFKNGKMEGKGLLNYNQAFEDLVSIDVQWEKYEGEFKDGLITGFGNLYLNNGLALIGYWQEGKPHYYTKVNSLSISL